jgi:hypothetical protein
MGFVLSLAASSSAAISARRASIRERKEIRLD